MFLELALKLILALTVAGGVAFAAFILIAAFTIISVGVKLGEDFGFWTVSRQMQDEIDFYFFNRFGALGLVLTFFILLIGGINIVMFSLACAFLTACIMLVKAITYHHQNEN
jgi:hypothetical protein